MSHSIDSEAKRQEPTGRSFSERIKEYIDTNEAVLLEKVCLEVVAYVYQPANRLSSQEAERILTLLRGNRKFNLMTTVGNALIFSGMESFTVHRQLAQAAIEQKQYDLANFILTNLVGKSTQIDPRSPFQTDPLRPFQIDPLRPA